jgi:NADH-quinone oxidoreductase subunit J
MAAVIFWVMAVVAVLGGIGVVASRQPIRSVLSLVVVMLALAVEFLILSAQFLFAVQIIVYAGAVMVLFLFVVTLLGPMKERRQVRFQWWLALLVALVFAGFLYSMLGSVRFRAPQQAALAVFGTVQDIAYGLFTKYLYPFELTSVLLLVAAVGAIYLSRGGHGIRTHREEDDRRA